jgi:hypothetical protein
LKDQARDHGVMIEMKMKMLTPMVVPLSASRRNDV